MKFGGKQRVRYETETPSPQIVLKEDVNEGRLQRASNVGCEQAEFKVINKKETKTAEHEGRGPGHCQYDSTGEGPEPAQVKKPFDLITTK